MGTCARVDSGPQALLDLTPTPTLTLTPPTPHLIPLTPTSTTALTPTLAQAIGTTNTPVAENGRKVWKENED